MDKAKEKWIKRMLINQLLKDNKLNQQIAKARIIINTFTSVSCFFLGIHFSSSIALGLGIFSSFLASSSWKKLLELEYNAELWKLIKIGD